MSFTPKTNNPQTDFSLTASKYNIGPYYLCSEDRAKSQIVDLGESGCTVIIHFCAKCRATNKSIGYQARMATRNPAEETAKP